MKNKIEIFKSKDNQMQVNVQFDKDTVWLSRNQMSFLFNRDVKTIGKHINNNFKENELLKNSVVAKFATTAKDGKRYDTEHYNLDIIVSVAYTVIQII